MKTTLPSSTETGRRPLYEQVADTLISLVRDGTFRPGDRVPSIRALSRQLNVSINTVSTAYARLEDLRIITARPQSGYYVMPRMPALPSEPDLSRPAVNPLEATTGELIMRIMKAVQQPDQVRFGAAIPDPELVPGEKLSRLMASSCRKYPHRATGYAMPPGDLSLRTQIARHMVEAGCVLAPDDLIITTGAGEAVALALRAVCNPGDTLAVGSPVYFNFLEMARSMGLAIVEIPSSPRDGISVEALEKAVTTRTVNACLIISNFNNPLGLCLTDARKRTIADLLGSRGIPLIEDDINGDLAFDNQRPSVIKTYDSTDTVLLCSSFSKTLAPGYRVGWIAPGRFRDTVENLKLTSSIASASPTQMAVAAFLQSGGYERHLRSIRKIYASRVARMTEAVAAAFPPDTRITHPSGGFTLWVEMPENISGLALYARAEAAGISIAPGEIFSATGAFQNCLRLNAALWSDETAWAIEALGRMAYDYYR